MYLEFYNLLEQPFGVTSDPRFLYFSMAHREALASLMYGIESDQGFVALIAEPGMGKTTLLFRLHELLGDSARTAFVFQTQCTSQEFMRYIATDLGVAEPAAETGVLVEQINQLLFSEANRQRRVVLVIDEAQNLDNEVLETIRMLSNFETPQAKLLQIVLAGQPQLAHKLMDPDLVQLRQRISTLIRLRRLKPNEIAEYIGYRLSVAGHAGPSLFSPRAISLIKESSGGIPRNINTICFNSLSLGYAKGEKAITRATVEEVIDDLDLHPLAAEDPGLETPSGQEAQPVPEGGEDGPDVSQLESENDDVRWLPPFQAIGDFLRYRMSLVICLLLLIACLIPWYPGSGQRAGLPAANATPEGGMTFTVVVKPDDTLSKICNLYLGKFNPSIAEEIRELNPGLSDVDHLVVGQKIQLPSALRLASSKQHE